MQIVVHTVLHTQFTQIKRVRIPTSKLWEGSIRASVLLLHEDPQVFFFSSIATMQLNTYVVGAHVCDLKFGIAWEEFLLQMIAQHCPSPILMMP